MKRLAVKLKNLISALLFKMIRGLIWFFYPKIKVSGLENLPSEPCIIAANHCQMHGPIACELHLPVPRSIWCAGEMMSLRDVPEYAFSDFWSQKPKRTHLFYRVLSYLIAPLAAVVFKNAQTIGVYRDARIISTFKETVRDMQMGKHIVIFPEQDKQHNNILYDFQDKFIDTAKLFTKKGGIPPMFVPMYIAPKLKHMYIGRPTRFSPDLPIEQERIRIRDYLMEEITHIARELPEHTVIPYRNIPKKLYPKNNQGVQ